MKLRRLNLDTSWEIIWEGFNIVIDPWLVGSEVDYPVPLHRQKCFLSLFSDPNNLKQTDLAASQVLSLPIFPEITVEEQNTVVQRVIECLGATKQRTYRMAS